jgi:hypothetical protein
MATRLESDISVGQISSVMVGKLNLFLVERAAPDSDICCLIDLFFHGEVFAHPYRIFM